MKRPKRITSFHNALVRVLRGNAEPTLEKVETEETGIGAYNSLQVHEEMDFDYMLKITGLAFLNNIIKTQLPFPYKEQRMARRGTKSFKLKCKYLTVGMESVPTVNT